MEDALEKSKTVIESMKMVLVLNAVKDTFFPWECVSELLKLQMFQIVPSKTNMAVSNANKDFI